MYDPKLWGPYIPAGAEPEPQLPEGAKCDLHPDRFAFNLLVATTGLPGMSGADVYFCRECSSTSLLFTEAPRLQRSSAQIVIDMEDH